MDGVHRHSCLRKRARGGLLPTVSCCLALRAAAALSPSANGPAADVVVTRSYSLRGDGDGGDGRFALNEVRPPPRDPSAEEDDVELFYPTTRRAFAFPHRSDEVLGVRQTSFGCGRLGAIVWPSAIALACLLGNDGEFVAGKRVLELGSGCGLPSLVAKRIGGAEDVLATDYWEESNGGGELRMGTANDGTRLVPKDLFGVNLAYNLGEDGASSVRHLDWHDEMGIIRATGDFRPDVVVGSDLVYYPMDTPPLLNTLKILLNAGGAADALLISPLDSEREALPEFRTRLEAGELGDGCDVAMDELEMAGMAANGDEERHKFLRIRVHSH